jgi:Tfp pilus assembly protein PilX
VKRNVSENNAAEAEEAVKEAEEAVKEAEEAVASDEATPIDKETALTATAPEECEVIDVVAPTEDDEKQPKEEPVAMTTTEPHVDETSETQENETPKGNVIEKQVEEITKDVAAVNVSGIPAPKAAPLNGGGSGGAGGKKKKKRGGGKK